MYFCAFAFSRSPHDGGKVTPLSVVDTLVFDGVRLIRLISASSPET
ncbi:MAG: hypothetical protein RL159_595, partial [Actinomycetota bacterium]